MLVFGDWFLGKELDGMRRQLNYVQFNFFDPKARPALRRELSLVQQLIPFQLLSNQHGDQIMHPSE